METTNQVLLPFAFTFGSNCNLHCNYIVIHTESYSAARAIMIEHYGSFWAFQYLFDDKFKESIEKFYLREVELGTSCIRY